MNDLYEEAPWDVIWQVSAACVKCNKFVPVSSLGATVWSGGDYDEVIDLTDCPRCGVQRIREVYRPISKVRAA